MLIALTAILGGLAIALMLYVLLVLDDWPTITDRDVTLRSSSELPRIQGVDRAGVPVLSLPGRAETRMWSRMVIDHPGLGVCRACRGRGKRCLLEEAEGGGAQ